MINSNVIEFRDRSGNESAVHVVSYKGQASNIQIGTHRNVWGHWYSFETIARLEVR